MTQRRKIAIAYSFAVPVLLVVVLLQDGALFRLTAREVSTDRAVSALGASDRVLLALKDAEAQADRFLATGSDESLKEYTESASEAANAGKHLEEFAEEEPAIGPKGRELADLTAQQLDLLQRSIGLRATKRASLQLDSLAKRRSNLETETVRAGGEMRSDMQDLLQQQKTRAASSARTLDALIKYGGALTVWIVAVAAFLLFYDEKERFRAGMERQLQTEILETLPLGVCLATESDVILYANPAAEDTFGYQEGELVARDVSELHGPNEIGAQTKVAEIFAQLVPRELWSGELPIRTKDGEILKAASWVTNVKVGQKNCRLLIHTVPGHWNREDKESARAELSSTAGEAGGTQVPPLAAGEDAAASPRRRGSEAVGVSSR